MEPSNVGTLKCLKCGAATGRVAPQVCTRCFLQGWGRLPGMEIKTPEAPKVEPELYVSDKPKVDRRRKQ